MLLLLLLLLLYTTTATATTTTVATVTAATAITTIYIRKMKIHSSCEFEYFVETHLCKLCVILRSRVLQVVCPH